MSRERKRQTPEECRQPMFTSVDWLLLLLHSRAHTHEITYVVEDVVVVVDSDADATDSSGIHAKTSHILNYILMTLFVSSSVTSTAVKTLHINKKKKGYNVSSKSIISQCLPA